MQLLTFYHFCEIPDLNAELAEHKQFLQDIWVRGRIYLWTEWISATISALPGQVSAYQLYLWSKSYFQDIADIEIKTMDVAKHCFDKLIVRIRKEIVTVGTVVSPWDVQKNYKKILIEDVKYIIDTQDPDWIVLDMRNDYEYNLWHFKWAIPAWTDTFKDIHNKLITYPQQFGDKKILMYCTWWIRCEKLSVLCAKHDINNIYAVDGWVVKYVNTYNDWNRLWNLYTFDDRVSTYIGDKQTHTTIWVCLYSGIPTDNCENCRYSVCNARIIADPKHYRRHLGFCSRECFEAAQIDLMVKPVSRDPHDYAWLRLQIKNTPDQWNTIKENIAIRYRKNLHESYNHLKPHYENTHQS